MSIYETVIALMTPNSYFKTHATPRVLSPADYLGLIIIIIIIEIWLNKAMKPRRKLSAVWC